MSLKAALRRAINRSLEPMGFTFQRYFPEIQSRSMESLTVQERQIRMFKQSMVDALSQFPEIVECLPQDREIRDFISKLKACKIQQDRGGGGFSSAILLWTLARAIYPDLVIESGVFRGFTTWVIRTACPQARQYAFDISFAERQRIENGVEYHEADWMSVPVAVPEDRASLIYFDDHVDQWRRIREAAGRGFRYLIFDDSLPSTALHNDGWAPVPTIDMLYEDEIKDGETITWRTECGQFDYRYDRHTAAETRALVANHTHLPDLRFIFGYAPANMVLVVLK